MGLLERLPPRINEKPPHYFGRNDLETLLASGNCGDWIKIRQVKDTYTSHNSRKAFYCTVCRTVYVNMCVKYIESGTAR